MSQQFAANPAEIAGMGDLLDEVGRDAWKAAEFIGKNGPAADWLHGPIIDDLLEPVASLAETWRLRMLSIGTVTANTGLELRDAAWLYHDKDVQNYEALNKHKENLLATGDQSVPVYSDKEAVGATKAYEGAAKYAKPKEVKLDEPTANKEELAELISAVFPPLGAVNDTVKRLTKSIGNEVDPLGKCLEKVPGNWSEIRRIGESYKVAGQAMEACGDNFDAGLKRLSGSAADGQPHWDGKAAIAFEDWANSQVAAMKWEGPTGRLIAEGMGQVCNEIRSSIEQVLRWLWKLLESQIKVDGVTDAFKKIFQKIPVVGWAANITEFAYKLFQIVSDAIQLVQKIQALVDAVKKFIEIVKDPEKAVRDKANQKFEELVKPFAQGVKAADIMQDAAKTANLSQTIDRPKDKFETGDGQQPWANA